MTTPIVFLRSARLYLRPLEEADLDRCQRWINDPDVWSTLHMCRPMDAKAEKMWWDNQDRSSPPKSLNLAIVLKESHRHIGNAGIIGIDWINRSAETGTLIGEKDCWGNGYATEAKQAVLKYAFDTLNMHRMGSQVLATNEASVRHLTGHGYVKEGIRRQAMFRNGQWVDLHVYGLLASEWRKRQTT